MRFTRRHARALAAGAATTAAYLAGAKVTGSRAVRGSSLLLLALTATVGAAQASAVAKTTKKRLDQHIADVQPAIHFINHGGTISGAITCSGLSTGGGSVTTSGGAVNAGTGALTIGAITASGTCTLDHIVMNGNINMSGNNVNTATAYVVSGAPHRADLGAGATLAQVQARCDFFNQTFISEGLLT